MQTHFTEEQLAIPAIAEANRVLRKCVHCGFCLATCPTYVLLGDELDSPRGRIYLMKEMLDGGAPPVADTVKHIDRCLSCLSCMSTCPAGVDYMRLVDQTRIRIEQSYRRPIADRWLRRVLGWLLIRPRALRVAMSMGSLAKGIAGLLPPRLAVLARLSPGIVSGPSPNTCVGCHAAEGEKRFRVALLAGCVQSVTGTEIHDATIRLLRRHGCEVVIADGAGCCGALNHHLGNKDAALRTARDTLLAWWREIQAGGFDAIVINASGCGTVIKDYPHFFQDQPELHDAAVAVAERAVDVSELLAQLELRPGHAQTLAVAYHDACSLRHGQQITEAPRQLLADVGFDVRSPAEGHLCCGSAGTYNMLQPEIATKLGKRKSANLESLDPDVIAAGNLGCIVQIGQHTSLPVVHTVELLDWATGGPVPPAMSGKVRA
tara:strand:- start:4090 stop:5388 length:1299 start_codon:yes stop_codon:yes gene_type:complete